MNKLASISFVDSLGFPTIFPNIIQGKSEREVRESVDSFYFTYKPGWVVRCGEVPDRKAKVERGLPWAIAHRKDGLVRSIRKMQKQIGDRYVVFCHPVKEMVRGGVMLVEGDRIIVESATGGPKELSAFYRGYRSPEQQIIFNPGMFSQTRYGGEVLSSRDLLDVRNIERSLNWSEFGRVYDPVVVEFSWLKNGDLYVHDLSVVD